MTSLITYGHATLTIDGVTSFLQQTGVKNVSENTRFSPKKIYGKFQHSVQDGAFVKESEGFVHIFDIFVC